MLVLGASVTLVVLRAGLGKKQQQADLVRRLGQPGFLAPMKYQRPDALDRICLDFPDLVVVTAHMGFPWHDEILAMMQRHRNLHFMTSAWAPKYYPASVVAAIRSKRTSSRFIFASDYPLLPLSRGVAEVEAWGLDDETKDLFLGGNARRIFGLAEPPELVRGS